MNRILEKDGKLAKLTIMAFTDKNRIIPIPGEEFRTMFNPEQYTKKYNICYAQKKGMNKPKGELVYQNTEAQTFSFDFLLDGTGAASEKVEVSRKVNEFLSVVYNYSGKIKRPNYLKLYWGNELSSCVLNNVEVNYTLFRPNGTPLRAIIKATFKEDISDDFLNKLINRSSATLDKVRKIKDGDQLATMTQSMYGNIGRIAEIASINKLDNLRELPVGKNMLFPSFNKKKNDR